MNKLENLDCLNSPKNMSENINAMNTFHNDKNSFPEYIQHMVSLAKLKDHEDLLQFIDSSLKGSKSLEDIHFISSFLWHCNLKGKGKSIPITERKALSNRFEKIIIKMENHSLSSSDAQKELSVMRGTVNCMLYYCSK
ncbi:hypothetical protein ThvES_00002840 [Thiovulum sp. ES]|nr:hypothetical protein ThvES_00002840 [Thiovulum sp. ES]